MTTAFSLRMRRRTATSVMMRKETLMRMRSTPSKKVVIPKRLKILLEDGGRGAFPPRLRASGLDCTLVYKSGTVNLVMNGDNVLVC